jgi:hypothetical protein
VILTAGGVSAACSASSNDDVGSGGFGGGGSGGILIGNGGGLGSLPGSGGVPIGGGGSGSGGGSVSVPLGPQSENTCADAAKFAGAPAAGRLLYPYDGTVFPKGLNGPLFMWDGTAEQILFEAKSSQWNYTSCPATPDGVRYPIPDDVWARAGSWSQGTGDPLTVKITTLSGGKATGAITVNLMFALATLKGAIYYNTYGATGSVSNGNGAILKIVPGQPLPALFLTDNGVSPVGPCRSCHALSANGMMMTANHHFYPGVYESESYDVAGPQPTLIKGGIIEAGFAGIYPDGSRMMTNGPPNVSASVFFPTAPGNVPALVQGTAKLIDSRSGDPLPSPGWDAPHAQMPMFSPKGDMIVYNDHDKGQGHSLWVANFNPATNTFSGQKQIFKHDTLYAAWPFFTPDSRKVIFAVDSRADFASQVPDPLAATLIMTPTGRGHLVIIDLATGQAKDLDLANGYRNGQSYLPAGATRDNELEFFPTVSPVAAGGFFWAFFTSRRTYGNISTLDIENPITKKLWVTAIDIDAAPGADASHPAFYLPGQELQTGNLRAFAALEPCKEDGASCTSGTECCKGFCTNINPTTGVGICGKLDTCPHLGDKCVEDAECCKGEDNGAKGRRLYCIGGFCEQKAVM